MDTLLDVILGFLLVLCTLALVTMFGVGFYELGRYYGWWY